VDGEPFCIRPDPSTPSERPLGKSLGKSLPSAEPVATLKVLGLRAFCEADAGTRTPDPFITRVGPPRVNAGKYSVPGSSWSLVPAGVPQDERGGWRRSVLSGSGAARHRELPLANRCRLSELERPAVAPALGTPGRQVRAPHRGSTVVGVRHRWRQRP